ncbi:DUF4386 domain-containing protein [Flagellimonas sp. CMM7]|uniref:DUF4386 domain-containing protein n=1 Tax=Flagellimonas sp. CMM7 TaxID=2654676 RepID=UPI0013D210C2|nr:DUF4386 domain-containing protein [Flagellimonas sp. CMM7]UII79153.1 DUF4386 domain-containing protein [Flagellimonas sp. CMM7]
MKLNQKIGRTVGFLLLLIMVLGIPSVTLRGLSTSMVVSPTFLNEVFQNALQMRIAILLDILASTLWLIIAIILFPTIKKYKNSFALWFLGVWLVQFSVIIFSNISHLSLLSLSNVFVATEGTGTEFFSILGQLKIEEYFWAHFMSLMLYAAAAFCLYYFLFQTRLVPRFLSVWGMVAISLVFIASWLNIFDINPSFYLYSQNGIHMIAFIGWLIAKGFNTGETISKTK